MFNLGPVFFKVSFKASLGFGLGGCCSVSSRKRKFFG